MKAFEGKAWACAGQAFNRTNKALGANFDTIRKVRIGGQRGARRPLLPVIGFPPQPARETWGNERLATRKELSDFLIAVERRAFKQALFAVRDHDAALDTVQDAMMKLAEKYGDKAAEELPMLFQRILQNTIRDHYRRQKVRSMWTTLLSALGPTRDEPEHDPLEAVEASGASRFESPEERVQNSQVIESIENALQDLPARQREAFLLRYWEELDVAETAVAMGCSEGSVKTHCSRAAHALAAALRAKGIEL